MDLYSSKTFFRSFLPDIIAHVHHHCLKVSFHKIALRNIEKNSNFESLFVNFLMKPKRERTLENPVEIEN